MTRRYLLSRPLVRAVPRNPVRDTRGVIVGGGWAPNRTCGVDYDRSSTLRIAHRLGLPKLHMLTLDVRLSYPAHTFTSGSGNAILGAWERTERTLTALVGVETG